MSTRANIILVTPNNLVHQFYHHCDGYLSGVGEELRKYIVYSIGMNKVNENIPIYDCFVSKLIKDIDYDDEYKFNLTDSNRLHFDVEYIYVVKDSKLYYVHEWDLYEKMNTYQDLINYICKDENIIKLDKHVRDEDDGD